MNKIWEIVTDIFIGIIIIFISVMLYFGLKTETVLRSFYNKNVDEFLDNVKRNGVITISDYEKFLSKMDIGGNIFDINLEHRFKILEPEYRFRTLEEIIDEQKRNYTGPNEYHYREVITERPHVDDPINDGNLNTETNESVLEKAINGPADPNHVHDENCYSGHKHKGNLVFIHEHAHTGACKEFISYIMIPSTCNTCKREYIGGYVDYYWDSNLNTRVFNFSDTTGTGRCPYCKSTSIKNGELENYYQWSCGYDLEPGVVGSKERVPLNVVYYYEKTYPQSKERMTYNTGCYIYHKEKRMEFSLYDDTSISRAFSELLYNNFQGYCVIPEYISLGISTDRYLDEAKISDSQNLCRVTYRAYVNSSGTIRFKYAGYWYYDLPAARSYSGTDNPGFPSDISVSQLRSYMNKPTVNNWFYEFFRRNYNNVNNGDVSFHLHWFTRRWNSNGYSSWYEDTTTYLNVCDFDHTLGVNRWINTCGFEEDKTVDCNHIIVSLTPTHENQTVYVNDPLITTAVATYKDGSTKTVVCTTDFSTSSLVKDQDVTLIYNYTIDGKNYSISCKIKVSVIPRNKTCSKGHTYNLNSDGTDPGCPYCKAWIESLRVIRPETSPIVITIGTTLQDNGVVLLATYMDGHTEEVTSGYTDNLDKNYLGTMQVTIGYKGASITVLVTTVCKKIVCDICGYEYDLYPDGTNPGCPNCIRKIPVFTGNIMEYEHINHSEEILETLYDRGDYILNIDDIFTVTVKNKTSNIARMLLRKIYPSLSERWCLINKSEYILKR